MEEPPSLEVGPFQDTLAIEDVQLCHGLNARKVALACADAILAEAEVS